MNPAAAKVAACEEKVQIVAVPVDKPPQQK